MNSLQPGWPVELARGLMRLVAPNPGMMTGPGTNTYLLGEPEIAVIDPGPSINRHVQAFSTMPGPMRWVLVTHTHADRSPAAQAVALATGAELLGRPAPAGPHQDGGFRPGRVRPRRSPPCGRQSLDQ